MLGHLHCSHTVTYLLNNIPSVLYLAIVLCLILLVVVQCSMPVTVITSDTVIVDVLRTTGD